MAEPIISIPNIGPAMAAEFERAGITDAESIRALGADEAYARLLAAGARPHFIGYYALAMGLMGRPWTDCKGAEKEALRRRFHALKAKTTPKAGGIEQILDEIGVRAAT
ncbi:MAG TPA: competence protein TfoX [Maritimibacter sp.]|nr:competence protein TfoX [Maritimibacter sp.]